VQSLLFGAVMLLAAFMSYVLLVIADLQRTNRVLLEDTLERVKRVQLGGPNVAGTQYTVIELPADTAGVEEVQRFPRTDAIQQIVQPHLDREHLDRERALQDRHDHR
jgi:hypothetical protein